MPDLFLLRELAVIAAVGAAVTVALWRLRLPAVAGLLAAGALVGPYGLKLVSEIHAIEAIAEVGVVFLLFTIGLEFSLDRLANIFRRVAVGGLVQVAGTLAVSALVAHAFGASTPRAVFMGITVSLSSTAIVLRALADRGETDAPHGRFIVGTLIFQDLCIVPMMLVLPVLASPAPPAETALQLAAALGKAAFAIVLTLFFARHLAGYVFRRVDASRSREVFLLAVLAMCVGTAWLTSLAGLSLALGAFLGGMVVAGTEFQHRALGDIIPFRDAFVSVFFVSLGMLFDVRTIANHPLEVAGVLFALVFGKALLAGLAAAIMRFPARAIWLSGIGLAQFGEFGFVLLKAGEPLGLIDKDFSDILMAGGVISMFLTPVLIGLAPHITAGERILAPLARLLGAKSMDDDPETEKLSGHVIMVGYGVAGKLVSEALTASGAAHIILELNSVTVSKARKTGVPIYYADATSREALLHARVETARAVVVLINDPEAARRVTLAVNAAAPSIPVIIRCRYLGEAQGLLEMGATDVVAEEVEAGVEVLARLLRRLEIPRNVIENRISETRQELGSLNRRITVPRITVCETGALSELKIESVMVAADSTAVGNTLAELDLRRKTGALAVAVKRDGVLFDPPDSAGPIKTGDTLFLVGQLEAMNRAMKLFGAKITPPPEKNETP
ncbi:MAG: cation:proton antiporter [Deltaproteobacteria bacterium]|nr:cation:proton antiporter [Deltaproteobacteria bacterium]